MNVHGKNNKSSNSASTVIFIKIMKTSMNTFFQLFIYMKNALKGNEN